MNLLGLLQQINDFDPTTNLQYDWDSAYDSRCLHKMKQLVVELMSLQQVREGNVSFKIPYRFTWMVGI